MELTFSTNFKSYPITKGNFSLLFYYSAVGNQIWEPFSFTGGAFFYEKLFHFSRVVGKLSKHTHENGSYVETHFFSSKKVLRDTLHENFVQYEKWTLTELLSNLEKLNEAITLETRMARKLEPNRKGTFILLDLDGAPAEELSKSSALRERLQAAITEGSFNRIYVFLFSQKASALPVELHRFLDWAAYLEEENSLYAKGTFRLEDEVFNEKRRILGLLHKAGSQYLIPIHETIFEASEFKYLNDTHSELEAEAYRRFLNSLQR